MEQLWLPFPDDEYRPIYPAYYSPAFVELLKRQTSVEVIKKANKEARKRAKKMFANKGQTIRFVF
jgi:hypothetical protein